MQSRSAQIRNVPAPKKEYVLDYSCLNGGINLWDPETRLKANESPEMKNLLWRNGMLCSRKGQRFLCEYQLGQGLAAYPRLWHGCIFAHIGGNIFCFRLEEAAEEARSQSEASFACAPAGAMQASNRAEPGTWRVAGTTDATISDVYPRSKESGTETVVESGTGTVAESGYVATPVLLAVGVPKVRGTFFTYSDRLYYKTKGAYKEITATMVDGEWSFGCNEVFPYEPVIVINANPATGAGDLYQPENRMSSRKTVWYNAVDGAKTYALPVKAERVTYVEVNGYHVTSGWSYDAQNGRVLFDVAPPVTDPPTNNTVHITYELGNVEAQKAISDCRYVAVYGGTGELCVVMAGAEEQPNAYFWSGNSSIKMDASYFPMEQVQLAGSSEERITGFGRQQDNLIVFKERSVGKTTLGVQEINGRIMIDLPYIPINASIGCDLPWSIQIVENNLVFANRKGIYMLLDTTPANENNIVCISRKINGSAERQGYLADVGRIPQSASLTAPFRQGGQEGAREESAASFAETTDATVSVLYPRLNEGKREASGESEGGREGAAVGEDLVCSCDDGAHYYLTAGGHTWAWNYELSGWKDPSWFLLTNTNAVALICEGGEIYHVDGAGRVTGLHNNYNDYGEAIERVFRFPTMNFGSYDCRKNVNSVIVTLGAYEPEDTEIWYLTDYEERKDLTNLRVVGIPQSASLNSSLTISLRLGHATDLTCHRQVIQSRGDASLPFRQGGQDSVSVGTREQSTRVPAVFRRRPMCRRVLHFTMKLMNANLNEDFELVGAQVFYNVQGRLR